MGQYLLYFVYKYLFFSFYLFFIELPAQIERDGSGDKQRRVSSDNDTD